MSVDTRTRLIVVTGLSGAGKSSALHALEDLGFETVDNLPVFLLEAALRGGGVDRPLAVGMDVRTRDFDARRLLSELEALSAQAQITLTLLYLECDDDILVRRYTETRRPHPFDGEIPVLSAIVLERQLLNPMKTAADQVIDTSNLTTADLKRTIKNTFGIDDRRSMRIHLVSFGYRNGVPREADLVFDVRFLNNPHYIPELKPKTGLDDDVGVFISKDRDYETFVRNIKSLLQPLLPRYQEEGKSYLTIAIGCTGGRHRSVFVLQELAAWLGTLGHEIDHRHRDLDF